MTRSLVSSIGVPRFGRLSQNQIAAKTGKIPNYVATLCDRAHNVVYVIYLLMLDRPHPSYAVRGNFTIAEISYL